MSEQVTARTEDGVLCISMQRAEKKNALTAEMYAALANTLERAAQDPAVRVALISGAEGVFTAGNDLEDFLRNPPLDEMAPVHRFISLLATTDLPLVAAVDGAAVGIGTTMLLHCELVFASERARFMLPFVNLGLVPEAGSSMLLAEGCGYRKAAELLMLGDAIGADEALACGIVSRIVASADLHPTALAAAQKLAAKPRAALRATKRLMRRPKEPLEQRLRAESRVFAACLQSAEAKEAFNAFLGKRAPDFSRFD
jgi:enoyl-CoA hydratase/carnithine racemase